MQWYVLYSFLRRVRLVGVERLKGIDTSQDATIAKEVQEFSWNEVAVLAK